MPIIRQQDPPSDRRFENSSPEIELLLRCSLSPSSDEDLAQIRALLDSGVDWATVLDLGNRHGVLPLVAHTVETLPECDLPDNVSEQLRRCSRSNTARSLQYSTELLDIFEAFEDENIRAIPFKGPILSAFSYGTISRRRFNDLDILVHRRDVSVAVDLLEARGYEWDRDAPRLDDSPILGGPVTLPLVCEYQLEHESCTVEVRWQVGESGIPFGLGFETMWDRRRTVSIAGGEVPALDPIDRILVLAYHGTKHNWHLLKWASDFAVTIEATDIEWSRLFRRASMYGVERKLLVALALSISLFDTTVPGPVERRVRDDDRAGELAETVAETIRAGGLPTRPTLVERLLFNGKASDSRRDVLRMVLGRQRLHPSIFEYEKLPLPGELHPLYYTVVPFRLTAERLLKAVRRS